MEPTRRPRVALLQTRWREDPAENFRCAVAALESMEPVQLAVLPEFFLGPPFYFPGRLHLKGVIDHPIPDPIFDQMGDIARRKGCWIVCGSVIERAGDDYYNTAVVLDDSGDIVARVRKAHLFSAEFVALKAGDEAVVLDTPFGRLGVCICSDFWIPEMPRMLALKGAEMIAIPGAALRNNLAATKPCIYATSVLNATDILYVGGVGKVSGERGGRTVTIDLAGHSTAATPEGIVAELEEQEAVLYADLDLDRLAELRQIDFSFAKTLYFGLHGRRPELYDRLLKHAEGVSGLGPVLAEYFRSRLKESFGRETAGT